VNYCVCYLNSKLKFSGAHSQKKGHFTFINFAARFSFQIHFAAAFRSKFILRPTFRSKFILRLLFVPNSFCGPLGMHVILRHVILRPAGNACHFAAHFSFQIHFAARFSFQIHFAAHFSFQIHFAAHFSFQIHFAAAFRSKFILRPAGNACHFAACGPLLVKNSFCGPLLVNVILRIAKIDNDPFFGNAPRFQCDQQSKLKLERRAAACRRVSKGQTQV